MSLADEKEPIRICWYGDPGSTKSTNLARLSDRGRLHIIDADGGLKSKALADFGANPANIEPYRDITYPALEGMFWDLKAELDDDPDYCIGLGLDTATETCQRLLSAIVDQKQGAKIAKAEAAGLDTDEIDPFFRDRDFYGTLTEQMRRLIRNWKDLNINLGITAHVRRDIDEDTKKVAYGPDTPPAVQSLILGAVDVIVHCRTDGVWPAGYEAGGAADMDIAIGEMRAGITPGYKAKDRFHATPRILVNPSFDRIIDYIDGTLTLENDEQQKAYRTLFQERKAKEKQVAEERRARKQAALQKRTAPGKKTTAAKAATTLADDDDSDDNGEGADDD